jgi:hypothetical protein
MRQIHWKLSQKTGTLLVREFGAPVLEQVLLVFAGADPDAPEDADWLFDRLFSLSWALLEQDIPHAVAWWERDTGSFASCPVACGADLTALLPRLMSQPLCLWEGDFSFPEGERCAHTAIFTAQPAAGYYGPRVTVITPRDPEHGGDGVFSITL